MQVKKRLLAFFLSVIIIASSAAAMLSAYAQEKSLEPNKLLFESVLNDRKWIVESLVADDLSGNPYAQINGSGSSFMKEVLYNYRNDEAFNFLVNSMIAYKNTGTYASNWTQELIACLLKLVGAISDEALIDFVDNNVKSVSAIQYEDILGAVLTENYTSSWGSTLFESDADIERYRQMSNMMSRLSDVASALKDGSSLLENGVFESADDAMSYADNFIKMYEDGMEDFLTLLPESRFDPDNKALVKKITAISAAGFSAIAEAYDPLGDISGSSAETAQSVSEFYGEYFAKEFNSLLKTLGKTFEIGSFAANYAIMLNALVSQKDTTVAVMDRLSGVTHNDDMSKMLNKFSSLVEEQGNTNALAYQGIIDYIEDSGYVQKKLNTAASKIYEEALGLNKTYITTTQLVLQESIISELYSIGKLMKIAVWVADKATNISETSKKIFLCEYISDMITAAQNLYRSDYLDYLNDKSDENAKKCIDDLEFIKKLKLFGEKQAYTSVCSQTESVVGILLGGGELSDDLERRYNNIVDAYLGCTISPTVTADFSLGKGDELTVMPMQLENGSWTLYGYCRRSSGKTFSFAEADMILLSELKINGGTLKIISNQAIGTELYLPAVTFSGNSTLEIRGSSAAVGDLSNTGTLILKTDSEFLINGYCSNTGTINIQGGGDVKLVAGSNKGTVNINDSEIYMSGSFTNNGNINGSFIVTGEGYRPYDNDYFDYKAPVLDGDGTYSHLVFDSTIKEGVQINGKQKVTTFLGSGNSRIRGGEHIYLTGSASLKDNYFSGNLTFNDYSTSSNITIGGCAYMIGENSFAGKTAFKDGLSMGSGCESLTINNQCEVSGDVVYSDGIINGSDWLRLRGNLNITAKNPQIQKLEFIGLTPQTVNSNSDLTVTELINNNMSIGGVSFDSPVYVTKTLKSSNYSAYTNGKNLIVTGSAEIENKEINGDISAENWECKENLLINGTFYTSGNISIADNVTLDIDGYNQNGGTLNVGKGAVINSGNTFITSGTVTNNGTINCEKDFKATAGIVNNSALFVKGDSELKGMSGSGTYTAKGDISASGAFTADELNFSSNMPQSFKNSSSTTVKRLYIENSSKTGFTVGSVINVTESFHDYCRNLINCQNVVLTENADFISQSMIKYDFYVSGNYVVPENETLEINGDLVLNSGAEITVEEGGAILVKDGIISTSSKINVKKNAQIIVSGCMSSSSDKITVDGDLIVEEDARFSSCTVSAAGLITFKGDLNVSSGTWNNPNIAFISKLPQIVNGSAFSVNNFTVNNSSKTGFGAECDIKVNGELSLFGVTNGESHIKCQ